MFSLKPGRLPAVPIKNVIFITRPLVHLMDFIVDNLHGWVFCFLLLFRWINVCGLLVGRKVSLERSISSSLSQGVVLCVRSISRFVDHPNNLSWLCRWTILNEPWQDKGVYGTLSLVDELPIEFYPLDSDVVSMEMDNTFKVNITGST